MREEVLTEEVTVSGVFILELTAGQTPMPEAIRRIHS
jgi:hypothetical protein